MKIIYSIFLLFLSVIGISAQASVSSSPASGVLVLDSKWRVTVPSSVLENEDPFRGNNDARQAQYDIKNNIRENAIRARGGLPPQAPPARVRGRGVECCASALYDPSCSARERRGARRRIAI